MADKNDQTLDRTLRQVLAAGNAEQNQHYPPNVFDTHYNMVTSFILTEGVKIFGENQYIKDLLRPFLKTILLPIKIGRAELPPDYRHYTSIGIYGPPDKSTCAKIADLKDGEVPTDVQLEEYREKNKMISWNLDLKESDEYDNLTNHPYKFPTYEKPIGCIFESQFIKVSPWVPFIELRYIRQPKVYRYGYIPNPDDSYSYDPTMTGAQETEWRTNADDLLFKGVNTLYSMYVRDGELRDGMLLLKKEGMF